MTDGNDCAYPNKDHMGDGPKGLTKREYFAAMAMQGILANQTISEDIKLQGGDSIFGGSITAILSVKMADALIATLNKQEAPK